LRWKVKSLFDCPFQLLLFPLLTLNEQKEREEVISTKWVLVVEPNLLYAKIWIAQAGLSVSSFSRCHGKRINLQKSEEIENLQENWANDNSRWGEIEIA
jgi:hypothetical protein